jgi:hypothetical protein
VTCWSRRALADDTRAHEDWQPRRLDAETIDRWKGGELPRDVEFPLNDSVEVLVGPLRGTGGAIITLVALDPEPPVPCGAWETVRTWNWISVCCGALDNMALQLTTPFLASLGRAGAAERQNR